MMSSVNFVKLSVSVVAFAVDWTVSLVATVVAGIRRGVILLRSNIRGVTVVASVATGVLAETANVLVVLKLKIDKNNDKHDIMATQI